MHAVIARRSARNDGHDPRAMTTPGRLLVAIFVAAFGALPLSAVTAAESRAVVSSRTTATLITDVDAVTAGQPFHAALRLRLAAGWHTYWQNPGDAGIAPTVAVTLSAGSLPGPLLWPVPQRITEGPLTAYGYTGDVILPMVVTPMLAAPGPGVAIQARAEWLVCRDVCVPEEGAFDLSLPAGPATPATEATLVEGALARVPRPAPFASTLAADGTLSLSGLPASAARHVEFLPLTDGAIEHSGVQTLASHDGAARIRIDRPADHATARPGVLLLTDATGGLAAYSIDPAPAATVAPAAALAPLLLLALVGGVLLNLMPCVFPILAMKAMALARLSGAETRRIRAEAASYSLGVVASFVALGAGLIALGSAGELSGWGFQFQSPVFVIAMAWLLFAVGLSLSGVFVVGEGLMGRGDALARRGGHAGSFLTGVLAVVVASPCTAPFMGAAIAGALTLPPAAALSVFAALGAGLALPYGIVALVPGLARLLPRPGRWMQTLQQVLAFPMYAAVVWLVWVASQQAGPAGVLTAGIGLVAVGLAAWSLGRPATGRRLVSRGVAVAAAVLLAFLLTSTASPPAEAAEPFTVARLDQLRAEGRPVFVNMTAAWCLSCLVNERIALSTMAVKDAFSRAHVTYLKGDWTSQNPAISMFLHQLGQDGVPLYVLYAPGRDPVVLPQILSEATILREVAKLGG